MSLSMRVDIEGGRLRVMGGFEKPGHLDIQTQMLAAMISACLEAAHQLDKSSDSNGALYESVVDIATSNTPGEGSKTTIFREPE